MHDKWGPGLCQDSKAVHMDTLTWDLEIGQAAPEMRDCGLTEQVSHRECPAGMYSSIPFGLAQCTVELPYVFLQCLLFGVISYWMIAFEASAGETSSRSQDISHLYECGAKNAYLWLQLLCSRHINLMSWMWRQEWLLQLHKLRDGTSTLAEWASLAFFWRRLYCVGKFFWYIFVIFLSLCIQTFYGETCCQNIQNQRPICQVESIE